MISSTWVESEDWYQVLKLSQKIDIKTWLDDQFKLYQLCKLFFWESDLIDLQTAENESSHHHSMKINEKEKLKHMWYWDWLQRLHDQLIEENHRWHHDISRIYLCLCIKQI